MTQKQITRLRTALEATVIEFPGAARRDAILIEESADVLDRGLRASERELAVRSLEVLSAKHLEARAALRRIQDGTYGVCMECQGYISPTRLAALPWAARCLGCQAARDSQCGALQMQTFFSLAA